MAVWDPNPTKTSCLIIDGGANVILPKNKHFNNYSEIIVKNGTLTIESELIVNEDGTVTLKGFDSYYNADTGIIRIGPTGKVIVPMIDSPINNPEPFISTFSDCAAGATVEVNDASGNRTVCVCVDPDSDPEERWEFSYIVQ
jgi:hypothetical protein